MRMSEDNQAEAKPKKKRSFQHRPMPKRNNTNVMSAEELNHSLASIYQDDSGSIPDMKKMNIRKNRSILATFSWLLALGVALAGLAWAGFFWFTPTTPGGSELVSLSIAGPNEVTLDAASTYTIKFKNDGAVPLRDITFSIYYPKGFIFATSTPALGNALHNSWSIETLSPHESGTIVIVGKNYGAENEQKSWRVFMNYTPSNFNSELQKTAILNTSINSSPVTLTVTGPDKAVVGTESGYSFVVTKNLSFNLPLELTTVLPPNFSITSSTPALNKNGLWLVRPTVTTSSLPGAEPTAATFTLRGKFTASTNTTSSPIQGVLSLPNGNDRIEIGRAAITPEIAKNNLDFSLAINGSLTDQTAKPGDLLTITLHFKNTSAGTLKNALVTLALDAPSTKKQSLLKWTDIADAADGEIRGVQIDDTVRRGTIVWNSGKIPALAKLNPNDEITIDLRLPIKDAAEFDLAAVKAATMSAVGNITFTNQTGATDGISLKPITITLNSDLKLDGRDAIEKNSQGQDVHTVGWVITNSFHSLKNIELTATAYGDISVITSPPAAGLLSYDPQTKKVTWTILEMPLATDVLNSSFAITINKSNPTQNTLLSKVHLTAEDAVTGQKIDLASEEISLNGDALTP